MEGCVLRSLLLIIVPSQHTAHTHTHTHTRIINTSTHPAHYISAPALLPVAFSIPFEQGALSKSKTEAKYNKKEVLKLKEVFDDADKDGSGEIEPSELQDSLKKTNLGAEAVDMFKSMDRDGSKRIDFSEYLRVGERGNMG